MDLQEKYYPAVSDHVIVAVVFVQVAVNALFAHRLREILRICVPSLMSKEAFLVIVQSCLLVSRTLLTGLPLSVFLLLMNLPYCPFVQVLWYRCFEYLCLQ